MHKFANRRNWHPWGIIISKWIYTYYSNETYLKYFYNDYKTADTAIA